MRIPICSLAFSLFVAATIISCGGNGITGVQVDAGLRPYVLPKSKVLAGVALDKIKQTDFYKRHQAQFDLPQLNQLPQQIGMDPRRDLSSILASWNGADVLTMTRGAFDSVQVEKRLSENAPSEKYNNLKLYGNGQVEFVLLPKGVALVGGASTIKKAVDQHANGGGGIPEDLQLQLTKLGSGTQAWLVSSGVISASQLSIRSDTAATLSSISDYINASAIGITFGSGAALDAHVYCISEEGSQRVHDALRGLIGLARLSTKDNQLDQLKMWDSIHVDRLGKEVHVTSDLTPELADKLMTVAPALTNRL